MSPDHVLLLSDLFYFYYFVRFFFFFFFVLIFFLFSLNNIRLISNAHFVRVFIRFGIYLSSLQMALYFIVDLLILSGSL